MGIFKFHFLFLLVLLLLVLPSGNRNISKLVQIQYARQIWLLFDELFLLTEFTNFPLASPKVATPTGRESSPDDYPNDRTLHEGSPSHTFTRLYSCITIQTPIRTLAATAGLKFGVEQLLGSLLSLRYQKQGTVLLHYSKSNRNPSFHPTLVEWFRVED
jgi:hypothetical protein